MAIKMAAQLKEAGIHQEIAATGDYSKVRVLEAERGGDAAQH